MTQTRDPERPHGGRALCPLLAPALLTLGLVTLGLATHTARSDEDPCAGFSWNVAHERALFASAPQSVTASRDAPSASLLAPGRLYRLRRRGR
jgi:hypothetical protein